MRAQPLPFVAVVVLALCFQTSRAQDTQPRPTSGAVPSPPVLYLNIVTSGAAADVQASDVHLLDNGATVAIQSFQPHTSNTSDRVILVIDDVNARLTTVAYERDQLKKFFLRNDGQLAVPFTLAVMTDQKTEIQPGFSQNGLEVNQSMQKYQIGLHEIRRDSQYGGFDRTDLCIRSLGQLVQYASTLPGHKLILFVSPGWPLLSGPRIELSAKQQRGIFQTVAQMQDAMLQGNITLDMLNPIGPAENLIRADYYQAFLKGIHKPVDVDIADLSLQVLATHSGGSVQQGTSDIVNMVDRSLGDLNHSLSVAFTPVQGESSTTYHSLELQVARPGVTVRMPDGYYAQSPAETDTSH